MLLYSMELSIMAGILKYLKHLSIPAIVVRYVVYGKYAANMQ